MTAVKSTGNRWWRSGTPGVRPLLSAAWRGALIMTTGLALYCFAAMLILKIPVGSLGLDALKGIVRFFVLTAVVSGIFGVAADTFLGRLGFAGLIPFITCGILVGSIFFYLLASPFFVDIPWLICAGVQGGITAGVMWWQARRFGPT